MGFKYLRFIASFVLICFTTTTVAWSVPEGLLSLNVKSVSQSALQLSLPQQLGTVKEVIPADSEKVIVHIQDAHANYEAQKNIQSILDYLVREHDYQLIGLEGASSSLDPRSYHFFPYADINMKVADALAQKGEVTGGELFALEISEGLKDYEGIFFEGVEKTDLYREDYTLFRKGLQTKEEAKPFFDSFDRELNILKSRIYNPELLKFDKKVLQYQNKQIELIQFISYLEKKAEEFLNIELTSPLNQKEYPFLCRMLRVQDRERELDDEGLQKEVTQLIHLMRERVFDERDKQHLIRGLTSITKRNQINQSLVTRLYETTGKAPREFFQFIYEASLQAQIDLSAYKNLRKFSEHFILQSEITGPEFFNEMNQLSRNLYEFLSKNENEQILIKLSEDLNLFKKLIAFELSYSDWKGLNGDVRKLTDRLLQLSNQEERDLGTLLENQKTFKPVYKNAIEFYRLAEERNKALFEQLQKQMKQMKQEKAILITGGFHSEGLAELIKDKNISYVGVQPQIQTEFGHEKYHQSVMGMSKTIFDTSQIQKVLGMVGDLKQIQLLGGDEKRQVEMLVDAVIDLLNILIERELSLNPNLRNNTEVLVQNISRYLESNVLFKQADLTVNYQTGLEDSSDKKGVEISLGLTNQSILIPIQEAVIIRPTFVVNKNQTQPLSEEAVLAQSLGSYEKDKERVREILRVNGLEEEWDKRVILNEWKEEIDLNLDGLESVDISLIEGMENLLHVSFYQTPVSREEIRQIYEKHPEPLDLTVVDTEQMWLKWRDFDPGAAGEEVSRRRSIMGNSPLTERQFGFDERLSVAGIEDARNRLTQAKGLFQLGFYEKMIHILLARSPGILPDNDEYRKQSFDLVYPLLFDQTQPVQIRRKAAKFFIQLLPGVESKFDDWDLQDKMVDLISSAVSAETASNLLKQLSKELNEQGAQKYKEYVEWGGGQYGSGPAGPYYKTARDAEHASRMILDPQAYLEEIGNPSIFNVIFRKQNWILVPMPAIFITLGTRVLLEASQISDYVLGGVAILIPIISLIAIFRMMLDKNRGKDLNYLELQNQILFESLGESDQEIVKAVNKKLWTTDSYFFNDEKHRQYIKLQFEKLRTTDAQIYLLNELAAAVIKYSEEKENPLLVEWLNNEIVAFYQFLTEISSVSEPIKDQSKNLREFLIQQFPDIPFPDIQRDISAPPIAEDSKTGKVRDDRQLEGASLGKQFSKDEFPFDYSDRSDPKERVSVDLTDDEANKLAVRHRSLREAQRHGEALDLLLEYRPLPAENIYQREIIEYLHSHHLYYYKDRKKRRSVARYYVELILATEGMKGVISQSREEIDQYAEILTNSEYGLDAKRLLRTYLMQENTDRFNYSIRKEDDKQKYYLTSDFIFETEHLIEDPLTVYRNRDFNEIEGLALVASFAWVIAIIPLVSIYHSFFDVNPHRFYTSHFNINVLISFVSLIVIVGTLKKVFNKIRERRELREELFDQNKLADRDIVSHVRRLIWESEKSLFNDKQSRKYLLSQFEYLDSLDSRLILLNEIASLIFKYADDFDNLNLKNRIIQDVQGFHEFLDEFQTESPRMQAQIESYKDQLSIRFSSLGFSISTTPDISETPEKLSIKLKKKKKKDDRQIEGASLGKEELRSQEPALEFDDAWRLYTEGQVQQAAEVIVALMRREGYIGNRKKAVLILRDAAINTNIPPPHRNVFATALIMLLPSMRSIQKRSVAVSEVANIFSNPNLSSDRNEAVKQVIKDIRALGKSYRKEADEIFAWHGAYGGSAGDAYSAMSSQLYSFVSAVQNPERHANRIVLFQDFFTKFLFQYMPFSLLPIGIHSFIVGPGPDAAIQNATIFSIFSILMTLIPFLWTAAIWAMSREINSGVWSEERRMLMPVATASRDVDGQPIQIKKKKTTYEVLRGYIFEENFFVQKGKEVFDQIEQLRHLDLKLGLLLEMFQAALLRYEGDESELLEYDELLEEYRAAQAEQQLRLKPTERNWFLFDQVSNYQDLLRSEMSDVSFEERSILDDRERDRRAVVGASLGDEDVQDFDFPQSTLTPGSTRGERIVFLGINMFTLGLFSFLFSMPIAIPALLLLVAVGTGAGGIYLARRDVEVNYRNISWVETDDEDEPKSTEAQSLGIGPDMGLNEMMRALHEYPENFGLRGMVLHRLGGLGREDEVMRVLEGGWAQGILFPDSYHEQHKQAIRRIRETKKGQQVIEEYKARVREDIKGRLDDLNNPSVYEQGEFREAVGFEEDTLMLNIKLGFLPFENVSLSKLRGIKNLGFLLFIYYDIGNEELGHLKEHANLRSLDLSELDIGNEELTHLSGLISLKNLDIKDTQVTGEGLVHLRKLTNLESLIMDRTQVMDEGLNYLRNLLNLKTLSLIGSEVGDRALEDIIQLTNLKELRLSGTRVTGTGLKQLEALRNLEVLNLTRTQIKGSDLEIISKLTNLKELYLARIRDVKNRNLEALLNLVKLEVVDLTGTGVNFRGRNEFKNKHPNRDVLEFFTARSLGVEGEFIQRVEPLFGIEGFVQVKKLSDVYWSFEDVDGKQYVLMKRDDVSTEELLFEYELNRFLREQSDGKAYVGNVSRIWTSENLDPYVLVDDTYYVLYESEEPIYPSQSARLFDSLKTFKPILSFDKDSRRISFPALDEEVTLINLELDLSEAEEASDAIFFSSIYPIDPTPLIQRFKDLFKKENLPEEIEHEGPKLFDLERGYDWHVSLKVKGLPSGVGSVYFSVDPSAKELDLVLAFSGLKNVSHRFIIDPEVRSDSGSNVVTLQKGTQHKHYSQNNLALQNEMERVVKDFFSQIMSIEEKEGVVTQEDSLISEAQSLGVEQLKETLVFKESVKESTRRFFRFKRVEFDEEVEKILAKTKVYDSHKELEGIHDTHLSILAALLVKDKKTGLRTLENVLELRGSDKPLSEFDIELIDLSKAKGSNKKVDLIVLRSPDEVFYLTAATDKFMYRVDGAVTDSHTYMEYQESMKDYEKTPYLTRPLQFVQIGFDKEDPIRVYIKDYTPGISFDEWLLVNRERLGDEGFLDNAFYQFGKVIGSFYQKVGGWPNAEVVVDDHKGELQFYLIDYQGKVQFYIDVANQFAGYLRDSMSNNLSHLGLSDERVQQLINVVLLGFDFSFSDPKLSKDVFELFSNSSYFEEIYQSYQASITDGDLPVVASREKVLSKVDASSLGLNNENSDQSRNLAIYLENWRFLERVKESINKSSKLGKYKLSASIDRLPFFNESYEPTLVVYVLVDSKGTKYTKDLEEVRGVLGEVDLKNFPEGPGLIGWMHVVVSRDASNNPVLIVSEVQPQNDYWSLRSRLKQRIKKWHKDTYRHIEDLIGAFNRPNISFAKIHFETMSEYFSKESKLQGRVHTLDMLRELYGSPTKAYQKLEGGLRFFSDFGSKLLQKGLVIWQRNSGEKIDFWPEPEKLSELESVEDSEVRERFESARQEGDLLVGLSRDGDGKIQPVYSKGREFRNVVNADSATFKAQWTDLRSVEEIPLAFTLMDEVSMETSVDWEMVPEDLKEYFLSGAVLVTSSEDIGEDYSVLMSVTPPEIGTRAGGRTGIVLKNGMPLIFSLNGQEFFLELKGVGTPEGGYDYEDSFRGIRGGLTAGEAKREFDALQQYGTFTLEGYEKETLVRVIASIQFEHKTNKQGYLLRLSPGSIRATHEGELIEKKDEKSWVQQAAYGYGKALAYQFVQGRIPLTNPEKLITINQGQRFVLTDFFASRMLYEYPFTSARRKELKVSDALLSSVSAVDSLHHFEKYDGFEFFVEGLVQGLLNHSGWNKEKEQELLNVNDLKGVYQFLWKSFFAEEYFEAKVRMGWLPRVTSLLYVDIPTDFVATLSERAHDAYDRNSNILNNDLEEDRREILERKQEVLFKAGFTSAGIIKAVNSVESRRAFRDLLEKNKFIEILDSPYSDLWELWGESGTTPSFLWNLIMLVDYLKEQINFLQQVSEYTEDRMVRIFAEQSRKIAMARYSELILMTPHDYLLKIQDDPTYSVKMSMLPYHTKETIKDVVDVMDAARSRASSLGQQQTDFKTGEIQVSKSLVKRIGSVDGVLISDMLSSLAFRATFIHQLDMGRIFSESFLKALSGFARASGYDDFREYFMYLNGIKDMDQYKREFGKFSLYWVQPESDVTLPLDYEGTGRYGLFFRTHKQYESFYLKLRELIRKKKESDEQNKKITIDLIGPGVFEEPLSILILMMTAYQKEGVSLEEIPLDFNILDRDTRVLEAFKRGEIIYPFIDLRHKDGGVYGQWNGFKHKFQKYIPNEGFRTVTPLEKDFEDMRNNIRKAFSFLPGVSDSWQFVTVDLDNPEVNAWVQAFKYKTRGDLESGKSDFVFFNQVHTLLDQHDLAVFHANIINRTSGGGFIYSNDPELADVSAASLGVVDRVRETAQLFSGRILPLSFYSSAKSSLYRLVMSSWYPKAFAAESADAESPRVVSFDRVLSETQSRVFNAYDLNSETFSVVMKTSDYFDVESESLLLTNNPKTVSLIFYYGTNKEAKQIENKIKFLKDKNGELINDRILVIPILKGDEVDSFQSYLTGKDFVQILNLAKQYFEEVSVNITQAMVHRRLSVVGSSELLSAIDLMLIQRLETPSSNELSDLGIELADFNRYALPHAFLLGMSEGDMSHPLMKPVRDNIRKDKKRGVFTFVKNSLREKISKLQQAFKAYQALLTAA